MAKLILWVSMKAKLFYLHQLYRVIFKKRYFGSDREIGEIEIKLNAFEFNKVTTHEFTLQSPNPNAVPAKIRVSVHLSDKCTVPFHAPVGQIAIKNFQILHAKTYLPK